MKSKILFLALMMSPLLVFGQSRSGLKGPQYKNYKVWKANNEAQPVHTLVILDKPKGPDAKNKRLFRKNNRADAQVATVKDRSKLKGPWAKNYKPWQRKERIESDSSYARNQ